MAQLLRVIIREKENQRTKDGTYNVKIRITHKGECRDISTRYYIKPEQLQEGTIIDHPSASLYNIGIRTILNIYDKKVEELGGRINDMDAKVLMNILRNVDQEGRDEDFFFLADKTIQSFRDTGQESYANLIQQTIDKLQEFSGPSLLFRDITPGYLTHFENDLKAKKKSPSTISIHLRNIRTIFNRGIDADKVSLEVYPFRRFKIQRSSGADRDMGIEDLRLLWNADLRLQSWRRARDLFFLSFFLCGLNFKDLLHAQRSDVKKGRLVIDRIKTGQPLSIKITPQAQEIIDRYPGEKFLLGILEEKIEVARKDRQTIIYKDVTDQTNRKLKDIAEELEIPYKLSTYYARHTWSSIAFNECEASEDIIALALGHASQRKITAGYIRKKYELVDQVNDRVIGLLT